MSTRSSTRRGCWVAMLIAALVSVQVNVLQAGHAFFRNNNVGGISVDTEGVLRNYDPAGRKLLKAELLKEVKAAPDALNMPVQMRVVSLRGLQAACEDAMKNSLGALPDEVRFLAGLQRIQYIFVEPETNDILLAGPGEGWKVDENANVVGVTTGRPVLQLDNLLTAFRFVEEARTNGITCSIDPTEQGYRNLNALLGQVQSLTRNNQAALEKRMKVAFGAQQISITGVPATSHFARVLVAADYRMKRYAMGLEKAPVRGLPSYLDMIKSRRSTSGNVNPRWWLTTSYEPLKRSEDGLAWELNGDGVKAMSENDFVSETGEVKSTGKTDPMAAKWADLFTEHYDDLSARDPVFRDLRNLMDMCVVAALISKENLMDIAGLSAPLITGQNSELTLQGWNAPKQVQPQCSFLKTRGGWIVTASGGVEVKSWEAASQTVVDTKVSSRRQKALASNRTAWWWN